MLQSFASYLPICVQDVALRNIADRLSSLQIGWHTDTKPLVLLFAGPSRCGKTKTAYLISELLSKERSSKPFVLDMGQYQMEQDVAKLNGAGPGYVGSPNGVLASLHNSDRHVVILDEIEKACPSVLVFFLSVFDKGEFRTGAHKLIDCKSAVFIMTSNIGSGLLGEKAAIVRQLSITSHRHFGEKELRPLFRANGWTPEFWNRIDMCVPFLPLSDMDVITGARHFLQVGFLR